MCADRAETVDTLVTNLRIRNNRGVYGYPTPSRATAPPSSALIIAQLLSEPHCRAVQLLQGAQILVGVTHPLSLKAGVPVDYSHGWTFH